MRVLGHSHLCSGGGQSFCQNIRQPPLAQAQGLSMLVSAALQHLQRSCFGMGSAVLHV